MEQLKHECGVALVRLLKPKSYYEQKYGTQSFLFFGIKKLRGLRVPARIEDEGLDVYEHGELCYN